MQEFTRDDITAHRFSVRWKGYDTREVDAYLARLAEHVGSMQQELERNQARAVDVLLQAQRVADETVAAAQYEADTLRENAANGLENARTEAAAMLGAARTDADRTLLSARVHAEAAIDESRSKIAELEAEGLARTEEIDRIADELRKSAATSAAVLQSVGSRLIEMAEHFELQLAASRDGITDITPDPTISPTNASTPRDDSGGWESRPRSSTAV
jgi:DivIVA domain-containing protein